MIYFTRTHQWLRFDGNIACMGISDHAAKALGEILAFETHDLGTRVKKGDVLATIETANAIEKYQALVDGEVVELNTILDKSPGLIGSSPEGEGWFVKLRIKALPDNGRREFHSPQDLLEYGRVFTCGAVPKGGHMKILYYDVLIVGAGQAGAQTAISLRQHGYTGTIGLIGKEYELPYERPALSKDYLSGDRPFDGLLIRSSEFWKKQDIALHLGVEAVLIDTEEKVINGKDGTLFGYQNLVWAAGGDARRLSCAGNNLANLHTIRSRADVDKLRDELDVARRVIVVGGGYLGLEAAATLKGLGKRRRSDRSRRSRARARLRRRCLTLFRSGASRAGNRSTAIVQCVSRRWRQWPRHGVELAGGELVEGDLILVAIGIDAAVAPLMRAGAKGRDGILIIPLARRTCPAFMPLAIAPSAQMFISDGAVMRIESVQNANDQADVAARAIIGMAASYEAVPWFWSNQFDLRLQTIGLSKQHDAVVIRGDREKRSFSVIYLLGAASWAMDCINATKDFVQGRSIVGKKLALPPDKLADVSISLKEIARMALRMENAL